MSDSNQPKASSSVPLGRIAAVAILAGGVIAMAVVAMNNQNRPVEQTTPNQEVANQTPSEEQAPDEPGLAKADLSRADQPTISRELTQRLTSPDAAVAAEAVKELRALQQTGDTEETTRQARLAEKQAAAIKTASDPRVANVKPAAPAAGPGNPNAMIAFEQTVYDFGDLYSTNPVDGKFVFTSTGTEPLVIERVQTTCGCTSANQDELKNSSWEPGTGAEILFTFKPSNHAGEQRKTIRVYTNSESNRVVVLEFKANYIPSVKLSSQMANFGRVEAGSIGQSRILIESRDPNFEFTNFDLGDSADQFTWSYTKLEPVSEQFPSRGQLLIQTKPTAMIGPMSRVIGRLVVRSSDGEADEQTEQEFNVVLRGEIIGQVEVEPAIARAPLAEPGAAFEHTFTVNSRKGEPFQITDVKLAQGDAKNFSFEITPVEDANGTAYRITVRGNAPDRTGGYLGKVAIYTDIENHGPMPFQFTGVTRATRPQ